MRYPAHLFAAITLSVALAGCARDVEQAPLSNRPPAVAPAPPAAPDGYTASMSIPSRDATGRYRTINTDLSPAGAVWHLRSALNVAALACRGPQEAELIAAYNRLLTTQRVPLARALKMLTAEFKESQGAEWQTIQDRQMTRLYNFFALPQAQAEFCASASVIAAEANATPTIAFEAFAPAALDRLEAPFTGYFARVDTYRSELAAWQRGSTIDTPRLAYADLDGVIAWEAERSSRYAGAQPRR